MKYVLVRLEFFSPYTSVPLYAEHGRGLLAPPPSTLIGALAAAYYYPEEREISEDFAKRVYYVSFWVPPYTEAENISRHFTWLSQRKSRMKIIDAALDYLAGRRSDEDVSKILENYANFDKDKFKELRDLGYAKGEVAREALQILFQPATRLEVYYWQPAYVLYVVEDGLERYAWNIFRVGPKETLVAATPLEVLKVERIEPGEWVKTRFYVSIDAIEECGGVINYMMEVPGGDINSLKPYCIPPRDDFIDAVPKPGWTGVLLKTQEEELEAVVPEYAAPRS